MKIKDETDPRKLLQRLVEQADMEGLLLDTHYKKEAWRKGPYYLPGGMLDSLSPVEREVLKQLTVEDCQNLRVDGISLKFRVPTEEETLKYNKKYGKKKDR